ncbi:ABC transporter ATP-binding protein [Lihuaxuella thermophila]|uniref:Putative ABC transport system ATP-binding protein n=1 Tax=Lihuaxuella thermophila TaxID=1173111 RepID=A0A1H8J3U0_9BACL|nr:ABC transporter ATP-binding protein [Lihuaxuella thermophila]SEN75560.1 putative ABC transport system ATP-binding protein [Lihuaxuella thermophila]
MLQLNRLGKVYGGSILCTALKDIDLTVDRGEFLGIMGPSGSGKTTLLRLIAALDVPTSGEVLIDGRNPHLLPRNELARFRRRELGLVLQDFNLLDTMTVEENIVMPLALEGVQYGEMAEKAAMVADQLGIGNILHKRVHEISGGQAQRAAIARAIIHGPGMLLCDEITGNLDSKSSQGVMEVLEAVHQTDGATILLVTHDPMVASYCRRVVFIKDGQLYNEIICGENRQHFFQRIMDTLSLMGGNIHDRMAFRLS